MARYKYLLLDADNTLFDFNRAEETAFHAAFSASGLYADDAVYTRYHEINDALWKQLERGEIDRARLVVLRFELLLQEMGVPDDGKSSEISRRYFYELGQQRFLLQGALNVCRELSDAYPLYIVTNGNTAIQESRYHGCGLEPYIKEVFISEKIGAAKPSVQYFGLVMEAIGDADPSHYLVVGDSLTSDIDGAIAARMDAVWLDHSGSGDTHGREIPYIIKDIRELPGLLAGESAR